MISWIVLHLLFATTTSSQNLKPQKLDNKRHCNTQNPTNDDITHTKKVMEAWTKKPKMLAHKMKIIVPTYFHAITDSLSGHITDDEINETMNVLNIAFARKFRFQLIGNTTTNNFNWYFYASYEMEMKQALRQGDCNALNIYSTSGYGALGFAYFPWTCATDKISDGVVIDSETKPGGNKPPYNEGQTLTHEVGHWLGLFHTFEGGCSGSGDTIDDTPAHAGPDMDCIAADTCASPGTNPIENFMNYTPDACMTTFTADQFTLMNAMWSEHRDYGSTIAPTTSLVPTTSALPSVTPSESMLPSIECNILRLKIIPDTYPGDIYWNITDIYNSTIHSGGPYGYYDYFISEDFCLDSMNCYVFTIFDRSGDGICCEYDSGYYEVYYKNELIKKGGKYTQSESSPPFGGDCPSVSPTTSPVPTTSALPSVTPSESMLPSIECTSLHLKIVLDGYPEETTWDITDTLGNTTVHTGGPYGYYDTSTSEDFCLISRKCYVFTIFDKYGDGICCNYYDNGHYEVYYDSELIKEGGEYGQSESSLPFGGGCPSASPTTSPTISSQPSSLPSLLPSTLPSTLPVPPTYMPTISPKCPSYNDPTFLYKNIKRHGCVWIGKKKKRRKRLCAKDPEIVSSCPVTCGICCINDPSYRRKNIPRKTCNWIMKQKKRRRDTLCKKAPVRSYCPRVCKQCSIKDV